MTTWLPLLSCTACYPLEQTLAGIDLELSSLQAAEENLKQTRIALANERNRSRFLNPVSRLPPEILATIFEIATSRYTRHDRTSSSRTHSCPNILASVSSSWRRIALGAPSLWSDIDLIIGGDRELHDNRQTGLWVERSCNSALYINIQKHSSDFTLDTVHSYHISSLLEFLAPLMHRVRALDMSATLQAQDVLSSVLSLWARRASPDITKTLQIVSNPYDLRDLDIVLGPASDGSFSADELSLFFQSFDRLVVQSCRISESVVFHEGLVELHLQDIGQSLSPTQQELVAMLASCPRLRILVLANCWIEPSEETPRPVTLNHLEYLSLESEHDSHGFVHVLPLLEIRSEGLSMSLTLDDDPDLTIQARAFFGQTKVTQLYAWGVHGDVPLSMILYPIPHLETLALDYFIISREASQGFFEPNDGDQNVVPWPRLRNLHLKDATIDIDCLRQLVELHHPLKILHMYRPVTEGGNQISITHGERAQLAQAMRTVEDFKILDWGSSTICNWDFVILDPY